MGSSIHGVRWGIAASAALAVIAAGCSGKDQAACRDDAHALVALLTAIDRPHYNVDPDVQLVARPDVPGPEGRTAVEMTLRAGRVTLDRDRRDLGADLVESLGDRVSQLARQHHGVPRLRIAIDAAVPWAEIVRVTDAAAAVGIAEIELMFAVPPVAITPPPRTAVDDELDREMNAAAGDKATRFARLVEREAKPCPALTRLFGEVGSEGGDKATFLIRGIEPALIDCQCAADVATLRSLMFRILDDRHPSAPLVVQLSATGRTVAFPAATPWRDASAQFTRTEPVHLIVAP